MVDLDERTAEVVSGSLERGASPRGAGTGHATPGRTLLALGPSAADEAVAEAVVTRLCRRLAPGPAGDLLDRPDAMDDLYCRAELDSLRAELVEQLDLMICTHSLPSQHQAGHRLITVELPEEHARTVIAAVAALPGQRIDAMLTARGWARRPAGAGAAAGARGHAMRRSGRALVFAGQALLRNDIPLPELLSRTAIEEVSSVLGGHAPGAVVRCRGYARPRFRGGRLVLAVEQDDPALLVAIDVRPDRPGSGRGRL